MHICKCVNRFDRGAHKRFWRIQLRRLNLQGHGHKSVLVVKLMKKRMSWCYFFALTRPKTLNAQRNTSDVVHNFKDKYLLRQFLSINVRSGIWKKSVITKLRIPSHSQSLCPAILNKWSQSRAAPSICDCRYSSSTIKIKRAAASRMGGYFTIWNMTGDLQAKSCITTCGILGLLERSYLKTSNN